MDVTRVESRAATAAGQLVLLGSQGADVVPLTERALVLGREPNQAEGEDALLLSSHGVSRRHCRIEPWEGGFRVRDLESKNGISVNGRRTHSAALEPFDCLRVCGYALVYLDADTDPRKVIQIMGRHEVSEVRHQATPREDELLALTLSIPDLGTRGELVSQLEALLERLQELLVCETLLLVLVERHDGSDRLRLIHGRLPPGGELRDLLPPVSQSLAARSVCQVPGLLVSSGHTLSFPVSHRPWTGTNERRHPGAEVRGALLLGVRPVNELSAASGQLLLALARQLAVLLSNARLHRQATIDPLTGLANRGSLEEALETEFRRAEREGSPLGLLLLDLDDFKQVNDELGHDAGDRVLRSVGAMLRRSLRGEDLAGRWGGEEFVVLLPGADGAGSETVAQKLIALLAAWPNGAGLAPSSMSVGVAAFPEHAQSPQVLLRYADQALYLAKRAGKGCARVHGAAESPQGGVLDPNRTLKTYSQTDAASREEQPAARAWLLNDLRPPVLLCRATATSLGRSAACDVVLPFPTVSRLHCVVHVDERDVIRLDDASSNGVLVNGVVLQEESTELTPGDRVTVGPYDFEVSEVESDSGHETRAGRMLLGALQRGQVARLLRWLAESQATGVLSVDGDEQQGQVELRDGALIRASAQGALLNDQAVHQLLELSEGCYRYVRGAVEGRAEVDPALLSSLTREDEDEDEQTSSERLLLDSSTRAEGVTRRRGGVRSSGRPGWRR